MSSGVGAVTTEVQPTSIQEEIGVAPRSEADTLPPPAETTTVTGGDMIMLRRLLVAMGEISITTGKARIERNDHLVQKAIDDAADARHREAENRSDKGGFFSGLETAAKALTLDLAKMKNLRDPLAAVEGSLEKAGDATIYSRKFCEDLEKGALEVAKWGAVAGSTALAIGSFGAAAPIAALAIVGAVMSCAAASDSTFHILEKCGVDKDTAMWIDVGLCVGGAVASGGSGVAQMLSTQSTQIGVAVRAGAIVADATSGASASVAGAAHIKVAKFERDAQFAAADAKTAEDSQRRIEKRIQVIFDAIRETVESVERGTKRVADGMNIQQSASMTMVRA